MRLRVAPLRERRDDIPVLAEHFWRAAVVHTGSRAQLAPSLLAALAAHDWPGNARELQNAVAAIAVTAPARGLVRADDVSAGLARRAGDCAGVARRGPPVVRGRLRARGAGALWPAARAPPRGSWA